MTTPAPHPRSLEALGLAVAAALEPLTYPGLPVTAPALLNGRELWELEPVAGDLGDWPVRMPDGSGDPLPLDRVLRNLGAAGPGGRVPVLAVGSNASPGQMAYKLAHAGLSGVLPMVPVRVGGIGVGLSGHISPRGYVSASPYTDPEAETPLVVTWPDPEQLAAVDATELPNYVRALLPAADFPVTLPSGRRLDGAYVYANARGVLGRPDGTRRPAGPQRAVLRGLLAESPPLRELLGPGPGDWVRRAAADAGVRARGTELFAEEGWLLPEPGLVRYAGTG